jgi:hypothetical protein
MSFSPSFILAHKRLAPSIPIGRFASYVNPQAIGFNSESDFYAPVEFSVQVADGVTGALRINVATQKNSNWMADMKDQLAKTLNVETQIDLKTVTGMPIERVSPTGLQNVGKLNVFDAKTGKLIRLSALPEVPVEYRVTKVADLHQWAEKLGDSIPEAVAAMLKGKDIHEVEEALRIDGSVQKAIENKIQGSASFGWNEFVRLHQSNSSKAQIPKEDAQKLLRKVSKQVLTYVRSFIGAANQQVKHHIAAEQAKKVTPKVLNKEDEHLFKPILGSIQSPPPGGIESTHSLYQNLVEDALSMPTLQKSLIASVYNFDVQTPQKRNNVIASVRPPMKRMVSSTQHHPMNAHIHHTLLPIRGTYPADYIVRHTRQDMSAKAPFIGDAQKVYAAYHKFVGANMAPPPLRIKGGVVVSQRETKRVLPKLIPIDCKHPSKRHTHSREQSNDEYANASIGSEMPRLIPIGEQTSSIGSEMPRLIPIGEQTSSIGSEMPRLIPIGEQTSSIGSGLPPLIPIGCHHRRSSSDEEVKAFIGSEMPKLIPIGEGVSSIGSEMPSLIPIEGRYPRSKKGGKKKNHNRFQELVEAELPRLIPINAPAPVEDVAADDEYSHLPSVDDVFK